MAYILISKALALKHMAQMAIAVSADNLYPPTIGIRLTPHRTLNLIIKTGPAAMGGEFVLRPVQRAITLFTAIETLDFQETPEAELRLFDELAHAHVASLRRDRREPAPSVRHDHCEPMQASRKA